MADTTEGVIATIAAAGGNDEVVFTAWNRIAKDDLGSNDVAFKNFRVNRLNPRAHRLTVTVPRLNRALRVHSVGFGIDVPSRQSGRKSRIERGGGEMKADFGAAAVGGAAVGGWGVLEKRLWERFRGAT